jgi:hypothetical protein
MNEVDNRETQPVQKTGLLQRFVVNFRTDRDFNLFLITGLFSGMAIGINTSIFNNYLSDVYHLAESSRGALELYREAPGLFIMVILAILNFLGDIRIAMVGMLAAGLGMLGLGLLSRLRCYDHLDDGIQSRHAYGFSGDAIYRDDAVETGIVRSPAWPHQRLQPDRDNLRFYFCLRRF